MGKVSKTGFAATLLLFLAANTSNAAAQQNEPICPLEPQANRTLVLFGSTSPIVAHDSLAAALAGPVDVSLPVGIYNITASSYDLHSTRQPSQNQPQEQFYLKTKQRANNEPD